ncbi:MAG TPA: hypothetical protein VL282_02525 [Tepidisphaeraceae bacterium]|jgi:hypothetical protein|nr:hypothetical protein [Tepidisphaeraceae bacterium]
MPSRPLNIIFSGMFAGDPGQGGATWAVLQYVLGLRDLGHAVHVIEPIPSETISPQVLQYFDHVREKFSLPGAALLHTPSGKTIGPAHDELRELATRADVLLNVSGMLHDPAIIERIPTRVYLDLDPAFIQLWHATQNIDMRFDAHTHFATVGQLIGTDRCSIPTCGREWIHTLPPVVLRHWPIATRIERDALTTIANWRGYGSIDHNGVHYGQKAHSLRRLIELPRMCGNRMQIALSIHPNEAKDLEALRANGWELVDPSEVDTPERYQKFIAGSWGEIGIAKSGYVISRSGWFSDRSACYLASGRPVVAQETGFSDVLPTGEGLFAFSDAAQCAAAVEQIRGNYARHSGAARHLAEAMLDSRRVLSRLLECVL